MELCTNVCISTVCFNNTEVDYTVTGANANKSDYYSKNILNFHKWYSHEATEGYTIIEGKIVGLGTSEDADLLRGTPIHLLKN